MTTKTKKTEAAKKTDKTKLEGTRIAFPKNAMQGLPAVTVDKHGTAVVAGFGQVRMRKIGVHRTNKKIIGNSMVVIIPSRGAENFSMLDLLRKNGINPYEKVSKLTKTDRQALINAFDSFQPARKRWATEKEISAYIKDEIAFRKEAVAAYLKAAAAGVKRSDLQLQAAERNLGAARIRVNKRKAELESANRKIVAFK
jgi:hypothetical protein